MKHMAQFIYRLRVIREEMLTEGPTAEEARITREHFNYLRGLTESGVVLLAGRTQTADDQTFGIVILQAQDEDTARDLMANDPAVMESIMHAELFPFAVALWSERGPEE